MTVHIDPAEVDLSTIDLSDEDFWGEPPAHREAVFAALRKHDPLPFFAEPEPHARFGSRGPHHCLGAHLARRRCEWSSRTSSR